MLNNIRARIYECESFNILKENVTKNNLFLRGISGSLISFLLDYCYSKINNKIVFISNDSEKISLIKDDLDFINECEYVSVYQTGKSTDNEEFTKSLSYLSDNEEFIVIVNSGSLNKKILSKEKFKDSLIELNKNDEYLFEELIHKLNEYNYERKDFVEGVGDYSVRGGIIDLFPENYDSPIRIEFFGETIDSIRVFDITTQRSVKELQRIKIVINISPKDEITETESKNTVLDYIPKDSIIFIDEPEIVSNNLEGISYKYLFPDNRCIFISILPSNDFINEYSLKEINFNTTPQPDFHSNLKLLYTNISEQLRNGISVNILCSDEHQSERIKSLLEDYENNLLGD
ncbi:MAG: hypothetical protein NTU73_13135, partial [Ignavibacteriae bacterium]|nr:hypothetical protein [Ignavibacteriota bacterium]